MSFRSAIASITGTVIEDADVIQAEWDAHKQGATRRLGTVNEARSTIDAITKHEGSRSSIADTLRSHCARHKLEDGDAVGDPNDVHHIISPEHTIGFSIEEGEDGYTRETLELLKLQYTILRRKGTLVGVCWTLLIRHEQSGPIRRI